VRAIFVALSLFCLLAACGGSNPGDSVKGFFDALQARDGEKAASFLSQAAVDEIGSIREYMMSDETQIAEAAAELGVPADQLSNADNRQFAAILLGSEMMAGEAEGLVVTVGEATINGSQAVVQVTYTQDGDADTDEINLILEDGVWKLTELDM
jgi:hypothetical protein